LRKARRDWADNPQLVDTYRQHRPMVERSIAWLIGPKTAAANSATAAPQQATDGSTPG
jgi:hypothetical protein